MEAIIKNLLTSIRTLTGIPTTYINENDKPSHTILNLDFTGIDEDGEYAFTLTLTSRATNILALSKYIEAEKSVNENLPMNDEEKNSFQQVDISEATGNKYKYRVMYNFEEAETIKEEITEYKKVFKLYINERVV